ncbi:MAG: BamA/TamA family outer membrane protein [Deltaproteobacteria bacterium]|nr:BamA/TamA family outer membrane protein [Deltaproteobacteria bacterium]
MRMHLMLLAAALLLAPRGAAGADGIEPEEELQGPVYVLESIEIRGNQKTSDATVLFFVQMSEGESFSPGDGRLEKSKYALLATGYFSDVELSLEKGSERGDVVLVITLVERSTFVFRDLVLGFSDITAYGGLSVADYNFLGRGIDLGGGLVVSDSHLGVDIHFRHPFIFHSRFSFGIHGYWLQGNDYMGYDDVIAMWPGMSEPQTRFARVSYLRRGGALELDFELVPQLTLGLEVRFEVVDATMPTAASHQVGGTTEPIDFGLLPGRSFISCISGVIGYDSRNDPFLPTRGLKLALTAEFSSPIIGSSYSYTKFVFTYDQLFRLPWNHSIRIGFLAGIIAGHAPFFERFYIGDLSDFIAQRVLGMAFEHRRSPNVFGTSIKDMRYEDIVGKLSLEYVISLYRHKRGVYGVDFFFSLGLFTLARARDLKIARDKYDEVSPFPLDLTSNIGFRMDTGIGYFEISVSNLLGLVPLRGP